MVSPSGNTSGASLVIEITPTSSEISGMPIFTRLRSDDFASSVICSNGEIFGGIVSPLTWLGLIIFMISYSYLVEVKKDAETFNPALTLVFGLIHGFGFASVLLELGLPKGKAVSSLFGFNLGVEFGQILVVTLAISTLYVLGKTKLIKYKENFYNISALFLIALGTFWFVGRVFSL